MGQEMVTWGADLVGLGIGGRGAWRHLERALKHGMERIKHCELGCASFTSSFG